LVGLITKHTFVASILWLQLVPDTEPASSATCLTEAEEIEEAVADAPGEEGVLVVVENTIRTNTVVEVEVEAVVVVAEEGLIQMAVTVDALPREADHSVICRVSFVA
jgi:hypothetical protein